MLKRGFLASNMIFVSLAHDKKILKKYFFNLEQVFKLISLRLKNRGYKKIMLDGPVCHKNFKRLN